MNKLAITFRRTGKLFSKIIPSCLGEILEMHSAVFNDIDRTFNVHYHGAVNNLIESHSLELPIQCTRQEV